MTNTQTQRKSEPVTYTDYNIFGGKVRLVGESGGPIVIDRDEAIEIAKKRRTNLVQIAYNKGNSPKSVCKIMDYSKFKYEQKKKEKEAKKKQREMASEIKEIKFSIRIDDGDKNTKLHKIREILDDGDKVKITIKLLRREMERPEFAKNTMLDILSCLDDVAELDQSPSFVGNIISCVIRKKSNVRKNNTQTS